MSEGIVIGNEINWDIFTNEETEKIWKCIKQGRYEDLGAVVWIQDHIHEVQLQNIKRVYAPKVNPFESKVQEDLMEAERENGGRPAIDTPEKEAEWQAKIEAEKVEQTAKLAELDSANKKEQGAVGELTPETVEEEPVIAPLEVEPVAPYVAVVNTDNVPVFATLEDAKASEVTPIEAIEAVPEAPEPVVEVVSDASLEAPTEEKLGVGKPCCGSVGKRHRKDCPQAG